MFFPVNPKAMNASFSYEGSIVPLPSSSKISNACFIYTTYYRGRVKVTYKSGLKPVCEGYDYFLFINNDDIILL